MSTIRIYGAYVHSAWYGTHVCTTQWWRSSVRLMVDCLLMGGSCKRTARQDLYLFLSNETFVQLKSKDTCNWTQHTQHTQPFGQSYTNKSWWMRFSSDHKFPIHIFWNRKYQIPITMKLPIKVECWRKEVFFCLSLFSTRKIELEPISAIVCRRLWPFKKN